MWLLASIGMQNVAMQYLGKHADDREIKPELWTLPALEALLFALTNDGSVRMRRAAIQAASFVQVSKWVAHVHDQPTLCQCMLLRSTKRTK